MTNRLQEIQAHLEGTSASDLESVPYLAHLHFDVGLLLRLLAAKTKECEAAEAVLKAHKKERGDMTWNRLVELCSFVLVLLALMAILVVGVGLIMGKVCF